MILKVLSLNNDLDKDNAQTFEMDFAIPPNKGDAIAAPKGIWSAYRSIYVHHIEHQNGKAVVVCTNGLISMGE